MPCPNCGGKILGDGYREVMHCEFSTPTGCEEPDSKVLYCNEDINKTDKERVDDVRKKV